MIHHLVPVNEPYEPHIAQELNSWPQRDGYIIQLFRVFANSFRFMKKGVCKLLDRESPISLRLREIVILRICANNNCEYEWGVHVAAFARAAKLTDEQVRATRLENADASCWDGDERILIRAIDELCITGSLSEPTKPAFQKIFNAEQQLEILALCGNYHTICFVANIANIDNEPFSVRFPE